MKNSYSPTPIEAAISRRREERATALDAARSAVAIFEADDRAGYEGDRAAVIAEARCRLASADADLAALLAG